MNPLKIICVCTKAVQSNHYLKTIHTSHLILQKAVDFALKVEQEYLIVKGIQQIDQDAIIVIVTLGQNPIR